MPRKILKRVLPNMHTMGSSKYLKIINRFLHREDLWHIHRRSIAKAFFIGMFVAFMPLPGHTLIVIALAMLLRANIIFSLAISWINNPFTIAPIFYLAYRVGTLAVGTHAQVHAPSVEFTWQWLITQLPLIGLELFVGALLCGLFFGGFAYAGIRLLWRAKVVHNLHLRRIKRQK